MNVGFLSINQLDAHPMTKVQGPAAILTRVAAGAKMLPDPGKENHAAQEVPCCLYCCSCNLRTYPNGVPGCPAFEACVRREKSSDRRSSCAGGARGARRYTCLQGQSHYHSSFSYSSPSH